MWSAVLGIVKLLGEFFGYVNNQQLINAGKAEQQVAQAAIAEKARDELHDIQVSVSSTDDIKRKQLRDKWTSKDD